MFSFVWKFYLQNVGSSLSAIGSRLKIHVSWNTTRLTLFVMETYGDWSDTNRRAYTWECLFKTKKMDCLVQSTKCKYFFPQQCNEKRWKHSFVQICLTLFFLFWTRCLPSQRAMFCENIIILLMQAVEMRMPSWLQHHRGYELISICIDIQL